jgi:hypothetical protein
MTQYDLKRKVVCLSWLSNVASSRKDTQEILQIYARQQVLAVLADTTTRDLIGEWQVAWGPVVFQAPGSQYADNTMFVAKTDPNIYVIAIAGTDPLSRFGWVTEDGQVEKTVKWPYGTPENNPCISEGTFTGLNILLDMEYKGEKLLQFLHTISQEPIEVHVTGHSLGGALSPSLALALVDRQNQWEPNGNATIKVLPTAGATPGDANFASYYDSKLGVSTERIWNQKDIVPHAWELDMLDRIPELYKDSPELQPNPLIRATVSLAIGWSSFAPGSYQQICKQTSGFPSEINTATAVLDAPLHAIAKLIARAGLYYIGIHKPSKWLLASLTAIVEVILKYILHDSEHGEMAISLDEDRIQTIQEIAEPHLQALEAILQEHKGSISPKELDVRSWWKDFWDVVSSNLSGFLHFLGEAGYQHTVAYINQMEIQKFYDRFIALTKK